MALPPHSYTRYTNHTKLYLIKAVVYWWLGSSCSLCSALGSMTIHACIYTHIMILLFCMCCADFGGAWSLVL